MIEHLLEFIEVTHLDLYLQVESLLLEISMTTVDGIDDTSCEVNMIILQQYHIEETNTMIASTTDLHCLFLEHTHAGSGLTGIENTGLGAFQMLNITVSHRGDTTHTLHDVKHQALCLQQRTDLSRNHHCYIAFLHTTAITHQYLYLHGGVETTEHLLGNLHTCKNTIFLDEKMTLAHSILRDTTQRGVITIAYIFGKRQIDKSVN